MQATLTVTVLASLETILENSHWPCYIFGPECKTVREEGCQEALLNKKIAKHQSKPIVLTNRERQGPPFPPYFMFDALKSDLP